MRLEHKTLEEISDYLLENKYFHRNTEGSDKYYSMNKQRVSTILLDPVCVGVLQHGENTVNLLEHYDFIPLITVDQFMTINKLSDKGDLIRLAKSYKKNENVLADLLRDMVICGECGETMTAGITPKKGANGSVTRYFYYRCDDKSCTRYGKSIRAKVILDYIYALLDKKPFSSLESYEHYAVEIKRVNAERTNLARHKLLSLQTERGKTLEKIENIKELFLKKDNTESIKKYYVGDLEKAEKRLADIEEDEKKTRKIIENTKVGLLTQEKFLELMENIPKTLGSIKNMKELDTFLKKMFLNFTIKDKEVYKSTFNTPFDTLADQNVLNGAQERT